jgi:hypothetical protein
MTSLFSKQWSLIGELTRTMFLNVYVRVALKTMKASF